MPQQHRQCFPLSVKYVSFSLQRHFWPFIKKCTSTFLNLTKNLSILLPQFSVIKCSTHIPLAAIPLRLYLTMRPWERDKERKNKFNKSSARLDFQEELVVGGLCGNSAQRKKDDIIQGQMVEVIWGWFWRKWLRLQQFW